MVLRHINAIAEVGYSNKGGELIKSAQISGKTLNGSSMNSLNGILYQLNSLATVANELFQSVLDASKETYTRVNNISSRVKEVNDKLEGIESYIVQNSSQFYANGSYQMNEKNLKVLRNKSEHCIHKGNLPPALKWQYENNTESLPNFESLNEYHDKKDCLKDYSDPGFFFESWAQNELAKLEKQKREKKPKKQKTEKTIQIERTKYDEHSGSKKKDQKNQQTGEQDYHPPPPPEDEEHGDVPPPPPEEDENGDIPPPPPEDEDEGNNQEYQQTPQNPPPKTGGPPPPPKQQTQQPQQTSGGGPPPTGPPPPPKGPPPPPSTSGITFSKKDIDTTQKTQKTQTAGKNNLLDQIRNANNKDMLKKVEIKKEPLKVEPSPNSIASILENKFAKAMDSDSESDKDDDW